MRKKAQSWPHNFQTRWVRVELSDFGGLAALYGLRPTSISWSKTPGGVSSKSIKLQRETRFKVHLHHPAERSIEVVSWDPTVLNFDINGDGADQQVLLQTIPGRTPPGLIAALASLSWPGGHIIDDTSRTLAYALLTGFGGTSTIRRSTLDPNFDPSFEKAKQERLEMSKLTFETVVVKQGESPGCVSSESVRLGYGPHKVPPGVGVGSYFHVFRSNDEPAPSPPELVRVVSAPEPARAVSDPSSGPAPGHSGTWTEWCVSSGTQPCVHGGSAVRRPHWSCCGATDQSAACERGAEASRGVAPVRVAALPSTAATIEVAAIRVQAVASTATAHIEVRRLPFFFSLCSSALPRML